MTRKTPMTTAYQYSVRDRSGKLVTGSITAESEALVVQRLKAMGYAPLSITTAHAGMKKDLKIPGFGGKVKLKDLSIMARQFATMINAGLSLLRALTILTEQTENKVLASVLGTVRNEVEAGSALSAALAKHPRVFPPLLQVADNYEAEVKLKSKIKSAMTYPIVVLCIAIVAVFAMLLFVVPVFAKMFQQLGGKLPLPTQILVDISHGLNVFLPVVVIVVVGSTVTWSRIKLLPQTRNFIDPLKLKLPVFGSLFKKVAISRFSRNLGTMMRSGVPILQSLDIVADTTGNIVLARAVRDIQKSIREGESLTAPLANHAVFPPMVAQMMAVGEDTGALDNMLVKIAEFYDQEIEATTESLTALLEPLMIAFLGGIVGSMIVALYMPIFKIFTLIS
jgi:type IV pilus assembly protein PilC